MLHRFLRYIIVAFMGLTGCIAEDRQACPTQVKVIYSYTTNQEYADMFASRVRQVAIYVFDANERFLKLVIANQTQLVDDGKALKVDLPPGQYTILSWAGLPSWYEIGTDRNGVFSQDLTPGVTHLNDVRMQLPHQLPANEIIPIAKEPIDLFHGLARKVNVESYGQTLIPIDVVRNTHTIHIKVQGLSNLSSGPPNAAPLDMFLAADNGYLYADNTFHERGVGLKYLPNSSFVEADTMTTAIKTLRLMPSHPMMLTVRDALNGQIYFHFDLLPYIMQSPLLDNQKELDRQEQFDVVLDVNRQLVVTIYINGWKIITLTPQQ
ncbi:MAG: FimB/Mfa2 family fimbrial subunit [Mucinivorans sp.]